MPLKSTERTLRRCMRKLMREKQLDRITVAEICAMAEIGKRTFYRYYHDKYELFEDTYLNEFFKKLDLEDQFDTYDVFDGMMNQIYEEQDFFTHAIASKGQNGFWELVSDLLYPLISARLSDDPYTDEAKELYIRTDISITLQMIEHWMQRGFKQTPSELCEYVRMCNAFHGKCQYQLAMKRMPDEYSPELFERNEW